MKQNAMGKVFPSGPSMLDRSGMIEKFHRQAVDARCALRTQRERLKKLRNRPVLLDAEKHEARVLQIEIECEAEAIERNWIIVDSIRNRLVDRIRATL